MSELPDIPDNIVNAVAGWFGTSPIEAMAIVYQAARSTGKTDYRTFVEDDFNQARAKLKSDERHKP